ncbi:hypothetical protein A3K86_15635 [Photobacterium jeanii]|uniref:Uncharacterized protein n=1 Tax=Photobacterium jeanii TaxID=858640 RepID=A0A178K8N1_9GAMM|nr:hypothetical protein [Photobacterium jeanii]OAN13094.1 hypothetical protein A3K86_15635 [Photobacterium jeanii]PST89244.1 hypothetical protein C9I91_14080 [Photobacterium jeanii]
MNKLFTLILLITPSLASAFDGVFTMNNVKQVNYHAISHDRAEVFYRLFAKKRINVENSDKLINSRSKEGAREVLRFEQGRLVFSHSTIYFKTAYYFRGELYLENAFGELYEQSFSSPELVFEPKQGQLSAKMMTISLAKGLSITHGYKTQMLDEKFIKLKSVRVE